MLSGGCVGPTALHATSASFLRSDARSGSVLVTSIPGNQALVVSESAEKGSVHSQASAYRLLIFGWGSDGVAAAVRRAKISQVNTVEKAQWELFPIYSRRTVFVSGERGFARSGAKRLTQASTGNTKSDQLAELLRQYRADQITPYEDHRRRAAIVGKPQ